MDCGFYKTILSIETRLRRLRRLLEKFYKKTLVCQLCARVVEGVEFDYIGYLLWIAHLPRTLRQSVGCFQGVHSRTSSYYEIASDEQIRMSNSHN